MTFIHRVPNDLVLLPLNKSGRGTKEVERITIVTGHYEGSEK